MLDFPRPDTSPADTPVAGGDAPVLVVTGAGGGLGGRTAQLFAERGWRVVAVDLTVPDVSGATASLAVDVTDPESGGELAAGVLEATGGRVDAVVTFAGILGLGPLAEIDPGLVSRVLDVNVMGTVRTVHALFPMVHASDGRIVLIGSETGPQHAMPMNGPYAMSKHAVEAYADALRRELRFVGVPVTLLQPGPFRTGMTGAIRQGFADAVHEGSPFAPMAAVMGRMAAREDHGAADPELLAEAVWRAVTAVRAPIRRRVRWNTGRAALDLLPVRVVDALLYRILEPRIRRLG